jgi:hypothetical protein
MFTQTVARVLSRLGLDQRGTDPHPRQPAPMLLQKADALFSSSDWTYEPKWDGFRVLASVRDGSVRLISRNGHSFTNLFGPVSDVLRNFPTNLQAAEPGRTRPLECLVETCCLERRVAARRPVAIQKDPVQLWEIPCSPTSVHHLHRGDHCPLTHQNLQRSQVQTRFPC